jgi:carboxymethylenebutenolidase
MTEDPVRQAIALYDRFTHDGLDRRRFMAELARIAGSTAAASALLLLVAADPATAALTAPDDPGLTTHRVQWRTGPATIAKPPTPTGKDNAGAKAGRPVTPATPPYRVLNGYLAAPAGAPAPLPGVIVVHENRGLNGYIEDVARRLALAGFFTVAPDFLTPSGGTPADEDAARQAIGALDPARTIVDAVATIDWLRRNARTNGKIGILGFCWGGGLVDRVAAAAGTRLSAAVAFYGPPPDPAAASRVKAPIMLHYAGLDTRIDTAAEPWVKALKAAGVDVRAFVYPNVDHAFHNDTSAARYDAAAATLAWDRTIAFLRETLAPPPLPTLAPPPPRPRQGAARP